MKLIQLLLFLSIISFGLKAQTGSLTGTLKDGASEAVGFANVALYQKSDNKLAKVETSDDDGSFIFKGIQPGVYRLEATFVGYSPLVVDNISIIENEKKELGNLSFESDAVQLEEAVVKAKRALVEVKPDRTVFNVEGTINSAGDNAMGLLRKAPGVLVDNNDNISVLSRSGVLIYLDGKRLPLSGDALTSYLQNLPAEQIDKIDIITNPGAKYEAEGNAGIIDIRLKKDKSLGANGSVSSSFSQGRYPRGGVNVSGNYRNKTLNAFGTAGYSAGNSFNEIEFLNYQNGLLIDEINFTKSRFQELNARYGMDFFLNQKSTLGFLVTAGTNRSGNVQDNYSEISGGDNQPIDSLLIANNSSTGGRNNMTYNLNYMWNSGDKSLNIDADYGNYYTYNEFDQPNRYFTPDRSEILTSVLTAYDTPSSINIATFKIDYEIPLAGGKMGLGTKLSNVNTDNTFNFYDIDNDMRVFNTRRSNVFNYDENVYAGYLSYARPINQKWNLSAGLRTEYTDVFGELVAYEEDLQEDPVENNYINFFPTLGITYQMSPMQVFSLNYGSRINRPDYNVLNPFRIQQSELSFSKGNPFLNPEIVHNVELGYTLDYRFNFKLAYSKTFDQITRLIAPDDVDPRAGFITWANLAEQDVYSFNASLPFQINKWWSAYVNLNASHINNQAEYDDGGVVDIQTFNYSFFQQQTFKLPWKLTGEISGYYSGPGVWGGVFLYEPNWSLNLGLQRKFFNDKMNVKISANDLFYQTGWSGESAFNGLVSEGSGRWDSRRGSIAISYNFGNSNVKSRKRKTGLEDESKRVGE